MRLPEKRSRPPVRIPLTKRPLGMQYTLLICSSFDGGGPSTAPGKNGMPLKASPVLVILSPQEKRSSSRSKPRMASKPVDVR